MVTKQSAKTFPVDKMRLLHTMFRINNLEQSIKFYTGMLGMKLLRKNNYPEGDFTLAFLGYGDEANNTVLELTYNWKPIEYEKGTAFGHIAIAVEDIYQMCNFLQEQGIKVVRQPGPMKADASEIIAFIEDPDGYKIELVERS